MIKTIIFDFGGVISTWDPFTKVSENFNKKYKVNKRKFYDLLKANDNDYLLGNISTKEFWEKTAKKENISYEEFEKEISLFELNKEVIKLIENLKKKYELILLSDCYEAIHKKMGENPILTNIFEKEFYSNTLHKSKAIHKKNMFRFVLKKINRQPSECIFIDDKQSHIDTAKKIGIYSILFKNAKQLKNKLNNKLNIKAVNLKT